MISLAKPLLIYSLSAGTNVASTKYALQNPDNYEWNPVVRGDTRLYARAVIGVGLATLLDVELQKRAPKWTWVPRVVVPLASVLIAARDVRQR